MISQNLITAAELRRQDMIADATRYRIAADANRTPPTSRSTLVVLALALSLVCAVAIAGGLTHGSFG